MSQQPTTLEARAAQLRLNQTDAEQLLWQRLRAGRLLGHKFRRQVVVGPFIADFVCHAAKLIVEVDGSQHGDNADYDERRTRHLQSLGWAVLRVWNNDVSQRMNGVLEAILAAIDSPLPGGFAACPSPPSAGRVRS